MLLLLNLIYVSDRVSRGGVVETGRRRVGARREVPTTMVTKATPAAAVLERQNGGGGGSVAAALECGVGDIFLDMFFFYGRVEYTKVTRESWLQYKLQKL